MSDGVFKELSALETAWSRFATYDDNATVVRRKFLRLRIAMLVVGIAATALAIVYSQYVAESSARPTVGEWRFYVWLPVMVLPILGSVLAAGAAKLSRGIGWINLRGAAEAIKREIYRYRCGVGVYRAGNGEPPSRESNLAQAVAGVTARLMDTEAVNASLIPDRGKQLPPKYGVCEQDDGFSDLSPAQYLDWRLTDQLIYFRGKSLGLDRRYRHFQWWVAGLGGAGTLMAALGQEIWVPVSVGVATALVSYLELRNVEANLAGYNRAGLGLDNVATWWSGLPAAAKADAANFAALVDRTEAILGSENSTWVEEMQSATAAAEEQEEGAM